MKERRAHQSQSARPAKTPLVLCACERLVCLAAAVALLRSSVVSTIHLHGAQETTDRRTNNTKCNHTTRHTNTQKYAPVMMSLRLLSTPLAQCKRNKSCNQVNSLIPFSLIFCSIGTHSYCVSNSKKPGKINKITNSFKKKNRKLTTARCVSGLSAATTQS